MLILALETATPAGGAALLEDERLLAEEREVRGTRHAAALLGALDRLLAAGGRSLDQVEAIALSIGPGSFTGLRIGLATALGLCFGTGKRIIPVPTLAALARRAGNAERSVPMLDARRGQVYTGLYAPGGVPLRDDRVADPVPWLESLREAGDLHLLGPAVAPYRAEIESILGAAATILGEEIGTPRAPDVGRLGAEIARAGGSLPPEQVRLRYLRASEAEEKLRARRDAASGAGHLPGKLIT